MPRRIDQFLSNHPRRNLSSDDDDDGGLNPSLLLIGLIIIGVFIVSTIIHFLLRFITRLRKSAQIDHHNEAGSAAEEQQVVVVVDSDEDVTSLHSNRDENQKLIESLPLFSFESVTGLKSSASVDCAVCLSRFERHDQLRLLPICCHAFHSGCIDVWLSSNTTCPLCRSEVNVEKSDDYMKLFRDSSRSSFFGGGSGNDSFRIEIGSVSRRRISPLEQTDDRRQPRSYSMGSFEYVVDDDESAEVVVSEQQQQQQPTHRRGVSECTGFGAKDEVSAPATETTPNPNPNPLPPGSEIAGEVAEGRGWLRDYVDKLSSSSSLSRSLRFSGRFFTGSNRMSEGISRSGRRSIDIDGGDSRGGSWDLEGNRFGEEISHFFRWLSGV